MRYCQCSPGSLLTGPVSQSTEFRYLSYQRLIRICAYAQTRQSFCCSHTQSVNVDEGSDQNLEFKLRWILQYGRLYWEAFAIRIGISCTGPHILAFPWECVTYRIGKQLRLVYACLSISLLHTKLESWWRFWTKLEMSRRQASQHGTSSWLDTCRSYSNFGFVIWNAFWVPNDHQYVKILYHSLDFFTRYVDIWNHLGLRF